MFSRGCMMSGIGFQGGFCAGCEKRRLALVGRTRSCRPNHLGQITFPEVMMSAKENNSSWLATIVLVSFSVAVVTSIIALSVVMESASSESDRTQLLEQLTRGCPVEPVVIENRWNFRSVKICAYETSEGLQLVIATVSKDGEKQYELLRANPQGDQELQIWLRRMCEYAQSRHVACRAFVTTKST